MAGAIDITTMAVRLTARDFLSPILRNVAGTFKNTSGVAARSFTQMANALEAGGARGAAAATGLALGLRQLSMMYDRLTFAMVGFIKQSVQAAAKFETTMMRFSVITGIVGDDLDRVKQAIIAFTGPLPTSANEVAKAAVAFAKMGFAARLGAKGLIEISMEAIKFGRAIGVADEQAAMYLGKLATWLNIQDPTASKMKEVASMVTRLGWTIKGTAQDVIKATERFGAFTRALGATEGETLALAALVQDSGILIRRGSTAINRTFQLMSVNAGRFGRSLQKAGVVQTAEEFERLFQTSPVEAFRKVLIALSREGGAYGAVMLKSLGLHGNYISDLITMSRNLSGFQRGLDAVNQAQEDARNGMAATDKAYEAAMATFEQAQVKLGGAVENFMIVTGNLLLPALTAIMSTLADFIAWMIAAHPTITAVIGVILILITVLLVLGLVVKIVVVAFAALGVVGLATFGLLLLKILLVLAVLFAVAAAVIWIGNKLGWWNVTLDSIAKGIEDVGKKAKDAAFKGVEGQGTLGAPTVTGGGEGAAPTVRPIELTPMQAGGIAVAPTPVVVAEKEPEAIAPLSALAEMMSGFAEQVVAAMGGGGGGSVAVTAPVYLDGRRLAESQAEQDDLDDLRTGRLG